MSIYMMVSGSDHTDSVQIFGCMRSLIMNPVIRRDYGEGFDLQTPICSDVKTKTVYGLIDGHFFDPQIMIDLLNDDDAVEEMEVAFYQRGGYPWSVFLQHINGFRLIAETAKVAGKEMGWL